MTDSPLIIAGKQFKSRFFLGTGKFKNKKENINCLQLADLIAYPIARFIIDPTKANPAFDILEPKIYRNNEGIVGLKIYP